MKNGFIVDVWERVFYYLSFISIFKLVKLKIKITPAFVEKWVIFNTVISVMAPVIIYFTRFKVVAIILCCYGLIRIFEIIIYQMNVLLFDKLRAEKEGKEYRIESVTRMIILLLHNLAEIVFWFALLYLVNDLFIVGKGSLALVNYYSESLLCFATFSSDRNLSLARNIIVYRVAFIEICCGLFMTLLTLARFVGALPPVHSRND